MGRKSTERASQQLKVAKNQVDDKDPLYDSESENDCYFESYRPLRSKSEQREELQRSESTYVRDDCPRRPPKTTVSECSHTVSAMALTYSCC